MIEKRDRAIDIAKLVMAVLVICIHTDPLESYSVTGNFILTRVIARVAVPFFFMAAGYYFWGKTRSTAQVFKYLKKIAFLYLVWSAIYTLVNGYTWMKAGFTAEWLLQYGKQFVFVGSYYHLWFLPALMIAISIVYYLQKWMPLTAVVGISLVLYVFGLLADSYYGLATQVPILQQSIDSYLTLFEYSRNGLFFGFPYVALGAFLSQSTLRMKLSQSFCKFGLVLSVCCLIVEAAILRNWEWPRHDSMYLFLVPVVVIVFLLIMKTDMQERPFYKYTSDVSMLLYLIHPAVILAVRAISHLIPVLKTDSLIYFAATLTLSFTLSHLWLRRKRNVATTSLGRN
ncbi:MAG: acyltransferase family protein [Candidatus Pristimantibacillus lignocellulolyticus]|uniref:Acyltransferase family protein n=1 Tax=Candidatus Pristimantibacillus lignocellulolyticus TaxID=2994561 RepID=A0A9J6ZFN8_9BACL|nr:MAG: acyltransferase family protein [Candidatus Pristimantibacillus lignocellulolyticus]